MPQVRRTNRRRLIGLPSSKTAYQELRRVGRYIANNAGTNPIKKGLVAGAMYAAGNSYKKGPRKATKTMSTLARKVGVRTLTRTKMTGSKTQLEGQSLVINKTIPINIGGPGQVTKMSKLIDPLWTKYVFQFTRADRATLSESQGYNMLHCVQDSSLPLHCYELTFLPLQSTSHSALMCTFDQNGTWQIQDQQYAIKDAESGTGVNENAARCTTWLHHKSLVRLLLYGRFKQSTTYKIMFFRVATEENCPNLDSSIAGNNKANIQKSNWFHRLAKYTTNPVYVGHQAAKLRGDKQTGIKVLREFTYTIKEQLSSEDAINKVSVNITAYINKIKKHIHNDLFTPLDTDITGNVPQGSSHAYTNANKSPLPTQRLYMAIMATNYEVSTDANYEAPSYDISIQHVASASVLPGWPI